LAGFGLERAARFQLNFKLNGPWQTPLLEPLGNGRNGPPQLLRERGLGLGVEMLFQLIRCHFRRFYGTP
jgi:hypothetical protein